VERLIYRVCRIDPDREQRWNIYTLSLMVFTGVGILFLYLIQRLQGSLPFNPTGFTAGRAGAGVQHRGELRHQHQLAGLRR